MAMRYRHWRPISYYKAVMDLPNVTFIHPSLSNEELIKNCSIVFTVTGTAGLEAAYYGKPSIIFGHTSYDSLPSVHKIENLEDLPKIIRTCLDEKVNPSDVASLVKIIENVSFDFDLLGMYNKIDVILYGMETIGSAERATDVEQMREDFYTISNGDYARLLFKQFGRQRVVQELEEYLSLPMIPRFGGGIGLTRMGRAYNFAHDK